MEKFVVVECRCQECGYTAGPPELVRKELAPTWFAAQAARHAEQYEGHAVITTATPVCLVEKRERKRA